MARRVHYARDRRGRFARTTGRGGVYKRKSSTKRKLAIGGAVAVGVGAAVLANNQAYRRGARTGWEQGKKAGIYEGKPLRGAKGRIRPNSEKRDVSQNPYAKGYRPAGNNGSAMRNTAGKRARARRIASIRIDQNYAAGRPRSSGSHAAKRVRNAANTAGRKIKR